MAGESHPLQIDAQAPAHSNVKEAEGDGEAQAGIQYPVQETVGWIVIVLCVTEELHLMMENGDKSLGLGAANRAGWHTLIDLVGQFIQLANIGVYIQLRIDKAANQQGLPFGSVCSCIQFG